MVDKVFDAIKEKEISSVFKHPTQQSVRLGILLAIVGGFIDAYTFVSRGGVFANAQTGNIVLLGVYAAQGNIKQAIMHFPPILAFVIGVIVVERVKDDSSRFFMLDWNQAILLLEIIVLFITGFIPVKVPDSIVTVIISFVSSVQISAFRKLVDSPYCTTMCTGNLRTASHNAYVAFTQKDRKAAVTSMRYFIVISSFILGAFLGGTATLKIGVKSVWIAALVLTLALILFSFEEKNKNKIAA